MSQISWVDWLLSQKLYRCFCKIDMSYISDSFNCYGLRQKVPRFREALTMIKGDYEETDDEDLIDQATRLYGLLHVRFITTVNGMQKMQAKYQSGAFQRCPRFLCNGCECLPYGCSEVEGEGSLKMFCPNCGDVYDPDSPDLNKIDGAYFGPSWVHIFMQQHSEVVPHSPPRVYVPRVFGFKLTKKNEIEDNEEGENDKQK